MKILILGNGFIGKPLAEYLQADVSTKRLNKITKEDLNLYDVVINTAAKTNIDWCEKNRIETFDTNVTQAIRIAVLTEGKYVFFSSGCIFKSETPKDINYEDSIPNPQCFYTYTKLMTEQLLEEIKNDTLIIRPRLLISEKSHPRNTIDKLLKYDKIVTCQESATVLEDMLPVVKNLIETNASGPFNLFNKGTISPSEIMEVFNHTHQKITKDQLDELTKGRANRVSTILGTIRVIPGTKKEVTLPSIKKRIEEIRKGWFISS